MKSSATKIAWLLSSLVSLLMPVSALGQVGTNFHVWPSTNSFTGSDLMLIDRAVGGGVYGTRTATTTVFFSDPTIVSLIGNSINSAQLSLLPANNLSDLLSASTARANLGLGTAATFASTAFAKTANNLSDLASASAAMFNLGAAFTNQPNSFSQAQTFSATPVITAGSGSQAALVMSNGNGEILQLQLSTNSAANCILTLIGGGSGSGVSVASLTTNNTGGLVKIGTDPSGNSYYVLDLYGTSYTCIPLFALNSLIPGSQQIVGNGLPFVITSTSAPGGLLPGNYPSFWDSATNGLSDFPMLESGHVFAHQIIVGGSNFPATITHMALEIDRTTGNVSNYNNFRSGGGGAFAGIVTGLTFLAQTNATTAGVKYQTYYAGTEGLGVPTTGAAGVGLYVLEDTTTTPALRVDNEFSGANATNADFVTVKSNFVAKIGLSSLCTHASASITATGITNTMGVTGIAYVSCTAITVTLKDNAGTTVNTFTTLTANGQPMLLQPGGAITAASGLTGNLVPF